MSGLVPFLSAEWVARGRELLADLPVRPGATARLEHVVSDAPEGEVACRVVVADGRVADAALGPDPDAEVTVTTTYADAVLLTCGFLDPSVAVMQGRAKVAGDMGRLFAILPIARTREFRAALATLQERTAPTA